MQSIKFVGLLVGIAALLAGCASNMPGSTQHKVPPRMIADKNGNLVWDRPFAFGPVPSELKVEADADCRRAGFKHAVGYHPDALDQNGRRFPIGGFFCAGTLEKK